VEGFSVSRRKRGFIPDSVPAARVAAFLHDLVHRFPLLNERYERMTYGNRDAELDSAEKATRDQLISWGSHAPAYTIDGRAHVMAQSPADMRHDSVLRSKIALIPWLDSLGAMWSASRRSDDARAVWLFDYGGLNVLTPTLLRLATERALPEPVLQDVVDATFQAARRATTREQIDQFNGLGHLLTGAMQITRGDTTRAVKSLRIAACLSTSLASPSAVRLWTTLARTQHDTAQLLMSTTVQLLETGWELPRKMALAAQLDTIYRRYVATQGVPPDIANAAGTGLPPARTSMTLDAYLDREFTILYEREFPVEHMQGGGDMASSTADAPRDSHRLVVVEYLTGVFCEGCWHEDRAFQALSRRYHPEDVVTIAYHYDLPIRREEDSVGERFRQWYPGLGTLRYTRTGRSTIIPTRTIITPAGDTLDGVGWVDGFAPGGPVHWTERRERFWHANAVTLIERERARVPELSMRQDVTVEQDSLHVFVHFDSIPNRAGHQLALRMVLLQDTVHIRGGTIRRLYLNVVRAEARSSALPLGVPLAPSRTAASVAYVFDLGQITAQVAAMQHPPASYFAQASDPKTAAESYRTSYTNLFPDSRDWQMDRSRLHVVTFVQDLETGEVLQAVRTKVPVVH